MIVYYGYTHPKVEETFNQAKTISQTVEVNQKLAFILYGLQVYYMLSEKYEATQQLTDYALQLGKRQDDGYLFKLFGTHIEGVSGIQKGHFK